jgi:hypothetical protein
MTAIALRICTKKLIVDFSKVGVLEILIFKNQKLKELLLVQGLWVFMIFTTN